MGEGKQRLPQSDTHHTLPAQHPPSIGLAANSNQHTPATQPCNAPWRWRLPGAQWTRVYGRSPAAHCVGGWCGWWEGCGVRWSKGRWRVPAGEWLGYGVRLKSIRGNEQQISAAGQGSSLSGIHFAGGSCPPSPVTHTTLHNPAAPQSHSPTNPKPHSPTCVPLSHRSPDELRRLS